MRNRDIIHNMITKTIELKTIRDILSLDIVDLNRLNGYWSNPAECIDSMWSWLTMNGKGGFFASWVEPDTWGQHTREDFPEWKHVGNHVSVGIDYWAWFMSTRQNDSDSLSFSDSPDFYGDIGSNHFWGDIGKCSPDVITRTVKQMQAGDLWISLVGDGSLHIVLEARYSPMLEWSKTFSLHARPLLPIPR